MQIEELGDLGTGLPSGNPQRFRYAPRLLSPEDKARLRLEHQRQREAEEKQAIQEEAERQARLKETKMQMMRQAEEEEQRRLETMEEEKRHALQERSRREAERLEEERRKARMMEIKKQEARERKLEQARLLEEERKQAELRAEEAARKKEEDRRVLEANKKAKMKEIQEKFSNKAGTDPVLLTGSVTVQTSMSLEWRRRFYELTDSAMRFFRDARDRTQMVDLMSLTGGRVKAIKEPDEEYDELKAIPHAFVVEFSDGEGPWCLFADSAEDKDILISLLSQAAGL